MTRSIFSIFLLLLTISWNVQGQEVFADEDVFVENGIFYNLSDDSVFTGKLQKVRRNGHLVHESIYKEGYIVSSTLYYNRTIEPTPANRIKYYPKSSVIEKSTSFSLDGSEIEIEFFDTDGILASRKIYVSNILTYSCEFKNGEKHGTEFCIGKNGEEIIEKYKDGKRIK